MRFRSFCIGTLLTEIALEVVRKTTVSSVVPVGTYGYEVAWMHRFQAESWKCIILWWDHLSEDGVFSLWTATCWPNITYLSLWRTLFRFSGCFRWGSSHLNGSWVFSLSWSCWMCLQIMTWPIQEIDLPVLKWVGWIVLCKSLIFGWQRQEPRCPTSMWCHKVRWIQLYLYPCCIPPFWELLVYLFSCCVVKPR